MSRPRKVKDVLKSSTRISKKRKAAKSIGGQGGDANISRDDHSIDVSVDTPTPVPDDVERMKQGLPNEVAREGEMGDVDEADEADEEGSENIDFTVERCRIFTSDPAIFNLTIEGASMMFSARELMSMNCFRARFLNVLHRMPRLPKKPTDWHALVNKLIRDAEKVSQPPESSEDGLLRERIIAAIKDIPVGESAEDLDHGKALGIEGVRVFKLVTILDVLKDTHGKVKSHVASCHLRELGYVSTTFRFGDAVVRAWAPTTSVETPVKSPDQEPEPDFGKDHVLDADQESVKGNNPDVEQDLEEVL